MNNQREPPYSYTYRCWRCGRDWTEHRKDPLDEDLKQEEKLCRECLNNLTTTKMVDGVLDLGGMDQEKRCDNCQHFGGRDDVDPSDENRYWKGCGEHHEFASNDPDEHDEQCQLPIVYFLDVCDDWEPQDGSTEE